MTPAVLRYAHYRASREPRPMRAADIWRVSEAARRQLCLHPRRPMIEVGSVITRCRQLEVNDVRFETHWECGEAVHDEAGEPVLGSTEHDPQHAAAMIYLNAPLIGDRDDSLRSTALHELGHAVFDAPGWIHRTEALLPGGPERRYKSYGRLAPAPVDWQEWRANEFMGAFLAPRPLLHKHLVSVASALGLRLVASAQDEPLPVLNYAGCGARRLDAVAVELAEIFGVSASFMEVRLCKYGLVSGA